MKVLSKQNTESWTQEHTCTECDAQLEVNIDDVKVKYVKGYSYEDPDYYSYLVNCPVCFKSSTLITNLIPKLVQIEIQKKRR